MAFRYITSGLRKVAEIPDREVMELFDVGKEGRNDRTLVRIHVAIAVRKAVQRTESDPAAISGYVITVIVEISAAGIEELRPAFVSEERAQRPAPSSV